MKKDFGVVFVLRIALLLFIATSFVFAQAPDTLWTRIYGVSGPFEWFQSVQQLADSGYILTGEWNEDLLLMRTNSNGDSLWTKIYGEAGEDCGFCVRKTSDDGYIIAGLRATGYGDLWLLKTNASGDTVWTKTYSGPQDDIGFWVEQTSDGGYIIFGQTESFGGLYGAWLLKTDSSGNTLWTKVYENFTGNPGKSVHQTNDGGYILALNKLVSTAYDAYVIKTDSLGDTLWTRTYDGLGNDIFSTIAPTDDGGYVFAGYTGQVGMLLTDGLLVKTDSLGDSVWAHIYGGEGNEEFRSIQQTADGGFVITGAKSLTPMGYIDVWLMKIDALGDSVWARTWSIGEMSEGSEVEVCCDQGYVIAGSVFFAGTYDDAWLLKTEPEVGIQGYEEKFTVAAILEINPNPFRDKANIRYVLDDRYPIKDNNLRLEIYDATGRLVKELRHVTNQQIYWNGTDDSGNKLSSGVYFLKFKAGDYSATEKLLLIR